jgi:glycosyltransferase involved in cell wall biosynthesis
MSLEIVSIVIPCFKEVNTLEALVKRVLAVKTRVFHAYQFISVFNCYFIGCFCLSNNR